MEQDLILLGFDWKKTEADADKVIAQLQRVITAGADLEKSFSGINISGGFADSKRGAEQLNTTLKTTQKSYDDYSKNVISSAKAQEAEAKATVANEKAKQQLIKTEKAQNSVGDQAARNAAKEAKVIADLESDYKQLSLAYSDAAKKAKDYSVALGASHPASVQAVKDAKDLHDRLLEVDKSVGQSQRNVGNYPTTLEKVGNGFKNFASSALAAIGVLGAIDVAVQAIRGIFNLNKELESSVANLSAITGAEGKDLKDLTDAAIRLSTEGAAGAKDYVEAMKLIGSAKPELLASKEGLIQVTEAAKLLSEASGLELPDAATRLTDALNQFGEPAQKAKTYVDALAAAAKFGAAEVPQITEALLKFGSIAKSSNINIYESAAAIELLAERGLKGADAGTALRNVFLKLSAVNALGPRALKELEAAGVNTSILTDKSLSLETRLKELSKIQNDATALVKVFGTENLNAGQIILQNIPRYAELAKQIQTTGVASEQAAANTDTLAFKWEKFKNLLVAPFLEGNNSGIKKFVDGLSVSFVGLISIAGAVKTALANAFGALALGAGVLKDIATLDFSNIGKRIDKVNQERDAAEKMIKTQKELADAQATADKVAADAATKPLQAQKELLKANIALKDASFKTYNDLVSAGKKLTAEGHAASMQLYTDNKVVLALQKLIADEQKATSATATEDPTGAAAKKTKEVKHIKNISDAVADLRKELEKIQNNFDIGQITFKDADIDRVKAYQKAFDEIFDRGGKATTPIVQTLLAELDPITLRILPRQIKALTDSLKPDKLEIPVEPVIDKEKAFDGAAFQEEMLKNQLTIIEKYNFLELGELEAKHAAGKISEEEYQRQVFEISQKYAKETVKAQIASVKEQIGLLKPGSEREEAEKRLAELILKYNGIISSDRTKKNAQLIHEIEQIQSVFNDLASLGADVVNIGVTNQKNSLQDLEDTRQKNYQMEVDRINASTLTEQQKADKIKVLDAQRQAQKEEFDRKNREADRKKAAFDKQIAIMNIILNTAVSIAKVLGNPFQIVLAAALGAAQLAVAIATPIPHKEGLINNPKEHLALVGEAGKEIVIIPGQQPVMYDKPTTMFLPKGADVINEIMFKSMAKQTAGSIGGKNDKSEELLMELVNITRKNNKQTQRVDLSLKHNGEWEIYKRKYYS